jgi:mono/diheme cytochrome c family protein
MFRFASALAVVGVALLLGGCGGGDDNGGGATSGAATTQQTTSSGGSQSAQGKQIFTQNCGSCHTLADAGTNGSVGPNLDDLKPDESRVQNQVIKGGGPMPSFKGRLSDAQISAVATYVSSVAGQS